MQQVSFRFSAVTGLIIGVMVLGLAYVFIFCGPPDLRADHVGVASLVVTYVAGGLTGGAIYWLMQPLMARGHAGRGLVGFLSNAPLWVAVALTTVPRTMATREQGIVAGLVFAFFMGGGFFMVDR